MKLTKEDRQRLADKCAASRVTCSGCPDQHLCGMGRRNIEWLDSFIKEIDPGKSITVVAL